MGIFQLFLRVPMNVERRKSDKADILPVVVFCLCLLCLFKRPWHFEVPALYISLLGLAAVVTYFYARHLARVLFVVWAVVQLILIRNSDPAAGNVPDLSQGFSLPVYLPLTMGYNGYQIGVNLVAVFLLVLMKFLQSDEIIGQYLHFAAYRRDNSLGDVFPLKGKVERYVSLPDEKDWLLVNLKKSFKFKGRIIQYVLIKRSDKKAVRKNQSNQLVFFKPVPDLSILEKGENDIKNFKDEVWALCR